MSPVFIQPWRLHLLAFILLGCFSAVLWRLADLHVVKSKSLAQKVEANRKILVVEEARRGNILDRQGNLLAATRPIIEVGLDPQSLDPRDTPRWPELARLLGLPPEAVEKAAGLRLRPSDSGTLGTEVNLVRWVKLAGKVDDNTYQKILDLKIKGVYGNRRYERYYPGNSTAAHLLGYIGYVDRRQIFDGVESKETVLQPLMGVEQCMDFYLRGQNGWRESEHDGRRRELSQYRREVAPVDGLAVELTIDLVIQSMAEAEIERLVHEYHPSGVSIIVSEPHSGEILALANHPTFNPNEFWKSEIGHLRNRAVSDIFEPGSTFKIVAAGASLNEHIVSPQTIVDCSVGLVQYKGRKIRLPKDDHGLGKATVREIVYKSSNRGAAQLGMKLGEQRLYQYAKKFGFGEATGYEPGGEAKGILHTPDRWDGLTISRLPMGHAVSATPMQIHLAMSSIANGGLLMKPLVVRRVLDNQGRTVAAFSPFIRRRVLDPSTAANLRDMLRQVVSPEGTAVRASLPGFEAAGKTGTSQKIVDGKYSNQAHVATFSGFFPASDPQIAITVIVDEPKLKGTGYGGLVAAPSFQHIGEQLIQYLALKPPSQPRDREALLASASTHR